MYYASIGVIAIIVHVIINFEALRKVRNTSANKVRLMYREFLFVLLLYYVTDVLWGFFYEQRWLVLTFIDTTVYFAAMALSVLLWTRAAVAFTGRKSKRGKLLIGFGWLILVYQLTALLVNIFIPVLFTFTGEKEYLALPARYVALILQMILYVSTSIYSFVISLRHDGAKRFSYRTICGSSVVMALFIFLQSLFPFMPFYALGGLFSTCLIHTFVYKQKDTDHNHQMEMANQKAYRDGLTGVKNKLAYLEALADIETSLENGSLKEYGVAVFDLNGLKIINDTLGHEAGDEYIKTGCMLICKQFKHSPVFRIGGDEFVAILKGGDYEIREELEQAFRNTIDENQKNGAVVVSSGLAIYQPETDSSYNDVFKRADELMYKRKQALKAM